jgi:hypothetical protein
MVLGPQGPGRVGRRRFSVRTGPADGGARSSFEWGLRGLRGLLGRLAAACGDSSPGRAGCGVVCGGWCRGSGAAGSPRPPGGGPRGLLAWPRRVRVRLRGLADADWRLVRGACGGGRGVVRAVRARGVWWRRRSAGTRHRDSRASPGRVSVPRGCLPASAAACRLAALVRRSGQRGDAVLRPCQHRAASQPRAAGAQLGAMRVERARFGELVRLRERRLEEQGGASEAERAVSGAEGELRWGCAPEHVFVWCARGRMEGAPSPACS